MNILMLIVCCTLFPQGQGSTVPPSSSQTVRQVGVVIAVDAASRHITIKTDAGPELKITFGEATKFFRVAPGSSNLENATTISASELGVGDRILARGGSGGDPSSFVATTILIMSKADVAKKHAAERAEWERRGMGGVITAVNPASREVTIKTSAMADARPTVIAFAPGAVLRRYAANSVKFADARPSHFDELQVGDQVKALGTSNEDRSRFSAEELVSGSFRTIAGTVVELDPARGTILIADLLTNKRVQAQVTSDSAVRRLLPSLAQMLAARIQGGRTPAASSPSAAEDRLRTSSSASPSGESTRQQGPRDLQSLFDSLPPLSLAELKPGEAVILSCTKGEDPSRVTAITLLAGVELLLRASSRDGRALDLGSWNLDLSMNVGLP